MTTYTFWKIIDDPKQFSDEADQLGQIALTLKFLPAEDIVGFETVMSELTTLAYKNTLWGAAYLINGGCSDDGFDYFQGWLILQGPEVFEAALSNPDSLADYNGTEEDVECEDLLYLAAHAYKEVTGSDIYDALPTPTSERELGDDDWDFDDEGEMQKRYPKLFAKF